MCVIIDRKAEMVIPQAMIETACDINKHGYGLVYKDNDGLKIIRSLTNNDPKEVMALLKEHEHRRVWLHLRHATVGTVMEANSHPLVMLSKQEDGQDVVFMHNGTLYEFKKTGDEVYSDTYHFNEDLMKPLAKRCYAYDKQVLQSEFFRWHVKKSLGTTQSVLLFVDDTGYVLRGNSDKGKDYDWGWASNDYSFSTTHHRSSTVTTGGSYYSYESHFPDSHQDPIPWSKHNRKKKTPAPTPWGNWEDTVSAEVVEIVNDARKELDFAAVSHKLKEAWKVTEKSMSVDIQQAHSIVPIPRKTFCELAGIADLQDVERLAREDFVKLCEEHPDAMAELFIDLSAALRRMKAMKIAIEGAKKK
jgi:hypothetical protein